MRDRNRSQRANKDIVDLAAPWGLVLLSSLTAFGAITRIFGGAETDVLKRLDNTTLMYFIVAGAFLLLRQIKTFNFGDIKLEMLEKVKERQVQQEEKLDDFELVLPLLLPEKERKHLINLDEGKTKDYRGNKNLRDELRRLRSIGLIAMRRGYIADIKDNMIISLDDYVELTGLGRRWTKRIAEIEYKNDDNVQELESNAKITD
jgi:hypothetical protein